MIRPRALLSWLITAALALIVIWALLGALLIYRLHRTRLQAERFLISFKTLEVGRSRINEVSSLATKYHGAWRSRPTSGAGSPCGDGASVVEFVFDNYLLHKFYGYSMTRFDATIYVKDSLVCFRSISMDTVVHGVDGMYDGVFVEEFRRTPFSAPFSAGRLDHVEVSVTMDVRAPADARDAALTFNLDCLTKVRGCRDTEEIAPAIWRNSREIAPTRWRTQWDN